MRKGLLLVLLVIWILLMLLMAALPKHAPPTAGAQWKSPTPFPTVYEPDKTPISPPPIYRVRLPVVRFNFHGIWHPAITATPTVTPERRATPRTPTPGPTPLTEKTPTPTLTPKPSK